MLQVEIMAQEIELISALEGKEVSDEIRRTSMKIRVLLLYFDLVFMNISVLGLVGRSSNRYV